MMARETVPAAMSAAFAGSSGALPERLMAALEAAEGEGGDVRGRQSAAMVVVPADGEPWRRTLDLRVEDDAAPLVELRRLLLLQRAYDFAGAGDELMAAGRVEEAGEHYGRAAELAPESDELLFWSGLALAQAGDLEAGVAAVRKAAAVHPGWLVLLERLTPEFAPAGHAVRQALKGSR
jgi:tetratricopeptide (TPR) repeat protein